MKNPGDITIYGDWNSRWYKLRSIRHISLKVLGWRSYKAALRLLYVFILSVRYLWRITFWAIVEQTRKGRKSWRHLYYSVTFNPQSPQHFFLLKGWYSGCSTCMTFWPNQTWADTTFRRLSLSSNPWKSTIDTWLPFIQRWHHTISLFIPSIRHWRAPEIRPSLMSFYPLST